MNVSILVAKSLCGHKTESEVTLERVCPPAVNKKTVVNSHLNYNGNLTTIQYVMNWLLLTALKDKYSLCRMKVTIL
jgi:hypothetical protein